MSYFRSDDYQPFNSDSIKPITFFSLKSAKETDVVSHSPNVNAMFGLFSHRTINLIEKYKLPRIIKIKADIEGFKNNYFFIGFPILSYDLIDFTKSKFQDPKNQTLKIVKNIDEYIENSILNNNLHPRELFLTKDIDTDIFYLQSEGLFFSNTLLSELEKGKITGLEVTNTFLFS